MTYPIYHQGFEGASLPSELVDQDSAYAIDATVANLMSGAHSLKLTNLVGSHNLYSNISDSLGGDIVFTAYLKFGSTVNSALIMFRRSPTNQALPTDYLWGRFGASGLELHQVIAGTGSLLTTNISGVTPPLTTYLCFEIRAHANTFTMRVIRQDTGQFFVHSGSGSWSATPQGVTGTLTAVQTAGGWSFQIADSVGMNIDDLIIDPAVPSIDVPTFTLSSIGATQQLTAGGFTDPLFGVTWGSSNTGVATVSATGLVTAVAPGTATITATGKRDTGQTATAAATVATTPVSAITSTPPSPASGYAHNASNVITFALGTGSLAGSVIVTPGDSGGGGTFNPSTITLTNSTRSGTCQYTPPSAAVFAIGCTNNGGLTNPTTFNYTGLAQGLAVAPTAYQVGTAQTAAFTGTGTLWLSSPPIITASGIPATVGPVTVTTNIACTALVTPGSTQGTVTFTDSTTGAITTATVGPVIPVFSFLSSVTGFASGLVGTVGRTVLDSTGATYATRSAAGVFAVGTSGYAGVSQIPTSGQYIVLWDDGSGHQAWQETPVYAGGPVASVTAPITLPSIPANWLSAAGIAAGALAGKGDWFTATAYVIPPSPAVIASAVHTTQMAETYNADGVAPTLAQALYLVMQRLTDFNMLGTVVNVHKLDGTTTACQLTLTLDTSNNPIATTRSS